MAQAKKMLSKLKRYAEGGEVSEFPEEQASPTQQDLSEAARLMLYYKKTAAPKLPPGVVPDTGQADGIYQEPTVTNQTASVFGMQPRDDRLTILPRYVPGQGLVAPEMLYDAARAVAAPGAAAQGADVQVPDAINMAFNFTGAGLGTSAAMKKPTGTGGKVVASSVLPSSTTAKDDLAKVPKELQGSRVVDQSGEPLTVYHGTNTKNLKEFDTAKKGAWFSEDQYIAEAYTRREGADGGTIVSAKINVKNPLIVPKDIDMSKRYSVEEIINRINDDNATTYVPKDFGLKPNTEVPAFDVVSSPRFIKELKKGGFDGIKAYEGGYSTWNVFDNKQITRDLAKDISKSVLPSGTTAKEDLAKVPKAPKAEKGESLNKMLEKSVVKEPVYHASKADVKTFSPEYKTELSSMGYHFGTADQANFRTGQYDFSGDNVNIGKYYLDIKNPLETSHMGSFAPDHLADQMMEMGILDPAKYDALASKLDYESVPLGNALVKILKKNGYDGLKYANEREGEGFSFVPFDATQIKSATGNRGTYDPTTPDITKAKGGEVRKPK